MSVELCSDQEEKQLGLRGGGGWCIGRIVTGQGDEVGVVEADVGELGADGDDAFIGAGEGADGLARRRPVPPPEGNVVGGSS